jgi:membrane protease YdiL (CAAX protease family)
VSAEVAGFTLEQRPVADVRRLSSTVVAAGAYVTAITAAEVLAAFVGVVPAAALDAALLVALVTQYLLHAEDLAPDAVAARARIFAALTLVPLLRLSTLAMAPGDPLLFHVVSPAPSLHLGRGMSGLLRPEVAGIPLLMATILAARVLSLQGVLPMSEMRDRSQWCFALAAIAVAGAVTPLLGLGRITDAHGARDFTVVVVIFFFTGALEELVFRGLVQGALDAVVGGWAVPMANALFTATYLGSGSASYTLFMCAFGMTCGWWVRRTGSVAGAATAHGLLSVGLLVLWAGLL